MTANLQDTEDVLARTLYGEARSEGRQGLIAVACVILNRAAHPRWWGSSVRSVCLDPYQFSCWDLHDSNRAKLLVVTAANSIFVECQDIAEQALAGELVDPTDGADSYFAVGSPAPAWAIRAKHTVTIGAHSFYRLELPAPGNPLDEPDAPNQHAPIA